MIECFNLINSIVISVVNFMFSSVIVPSYNLTLGDTILYFAFISFIVWFVYRKVFTHD